jgi:hypothetical protein
MDVLLKVNYLEIQILVFLKRTRNLYKKRCRAN